MKTNSVKLSSPATHEFWEIPILFEDEYLFALEKPARVLTAPEISEIERPNLEDLLHAAIAAGKPWATERKLAYLNNPHRLDFDTSGILLFAREKSAYTALGDFFGSGKPFGKYLALVRGAPAENEFEIEAPLAPHPVKSALLRVDFENGKKSKTRFTVVENFPRHDFALLQCEPFTDRPHQIRVHLQYADLSVVGDDFYGGKKLWLSRLKPDFRLKEGREERPLISRAALHLAELNFPHPVTKENVTIKSELPKDLKVALKYLRQYSV